jgi:hypothetical protein
MTTTTGGRAGRLAPLFALLALALPTLLRSSETPMARVEAGLDGLQAQIKNASMRFKHVGSASTGAELTPSRKQTVGKPGQRCCSRNIEAMRGRLDAIFEAVTELHDQHTREHDSQALDAVGQIAAAVRDFAGYLQAFEHASENPVAGTALNNLGSSLRVLRRSAEAYAACCAGAEAPAPQEPPGDPEPEPPHDPVPGDAR